MTDTDLEEYAEATMPAPPPSLAASPNTNPQLAFSDPEYLAATGGDPGGDKGDDEFAGEARPGGGEWTSQDVARGKPSADDDFEQRLEGRLAPLEAERKGLREKALETERAGINQMDETIKRLEARKRPQLERAPEQPQAFGQQTVQYLQITALVGALAGSLVRGNTTAALNAFAGGVQGFMKGNREVFDAKMQEWKAASQRVKEDNQARLDEYDAALKDEQLTATAKLNRIKAVASMYDDQITWNLADQKDIVNVAMTIERQKQLAANAERDREKMDLTRENIQSQIAARAQKQQNPLSEDRIQAMIEARRQGDRDVTVGLARNAQVMQQWNNAWGQAQAAEAKERGVSLATIAKEQALRDQQFRGGYSYQRTAATRSANIENAVNEAKALIPQAVQASANFPRGKFVPWNEIKNAMAKYESDPRYSQYVIAIAGLKAAYMQALARTGTPTEGQRIEARADGILNLATDDASLRRQMAQMWTEMQAVQRSSAETIARPPTTFDPNAPPEPFPGGNLPPPTSARKPTTKTTVPTPSVGQPDAGWTVNRGAPQSPPANPAQEFNAE